MSIFTADEKVRSHSVKREWFQSCWWFYRWYWYIYRATEHLYDRAAVFGRDRWHVLGQIRPLLRLQRPGDIWESHSDLVLELGTVSTCFSPLWLNWEETCMEKSVRGRLNVFQCLVLELDVQCGFDEPGQTMLAATVNSKNPLGILSNNDTVYPQNMPTKWQCENIEHLQQRFDRKQSISGAFHMIFLYFFRKPSGLVPKYPNLVNHWPGRHVGLHRTGRLQTGPLKREPVWCQGGRFKDVSNQKQVEGYIYIYLYLYILMHILIHILIHIYIYYVYIYIYIYIFITYAHPLTHLYQQQCDAVVACFKVCRICSKDWFSNASWFNLDMWKNAHRKDVRNIEKLPVPPFLGNENFNSNLDNLV